MSTNAIAKRYAQALWKLSGADSTKAQDQLQKVMAIRELFGLQEAAGVLESPITPATLKRDLINYALGKSTPDETLNHFVDVVVEAGRIALFPEIIASFEALIHQQAGIVKTKIVSAVPMSEENLTKVKQMLESSWSKKIDLKTDVDESLLGGFVVRVGHTVIDLSVKTKLAHLAQEAAG